MKGLLTKIKEPIDNLFNVFKQRKEDKKSFWWLLGRVGTVALGTALSFSDVIIPEIFPSNTLVHKFALPISVGIDYIWQRTKYVNNKLPEGIKAIGDSLPNGLTGTPKQGGNSNAEGN